MMITDKLRNIRTEKPKNELFLRSSVPPFFRSSTTGQSLVELLIASGLTVLMLSALITGLVTGRSDVANESDRLLAIGYAREAEEAIRSVRETGWSAIAADGTYYPAVSGGIWTLVSGSEEVGGFRREIIISDAERDSSGIIVESGGTADPSTKFALVQISWGEGFAQSIRNRYYFTRHRNNTFFTHTSVADFDAGIHNNTKTDPAGEVTIQANAVINSYEEPFTTAGSYTYNSANIEVSDGVAQLLNQGAVLPQSNGVGNSEFSTSTDGWIFDSFGNNIGQAGSWISTGGNPGGYLNIDFGQSKNKDGSAYWYYPVTVNATDILATTTFQWRVSDFQGFNPDSMQIYAFVDTANTNPVIGEQIWSSGELTGTTAWSGTVTTDVTSKFSAPGTYYFKLMVRVSTLPSAGAPPSGPFSIDFDNVQLVWSGNTISYPTTGPTINPVSSFSNTSINSWTAFTETATKNGGEIYYQLSYNEGTDWLYWNGSIWATSTLSTHRNTATEVNANIDVFLSGPQKITFKAFLVGNGTQLVQLDNISIGYTTGASQSYSEPFTTSGSYAFDSSKIEVTGGFGQLKATSTTQTGYTTNPHFTTSSTGWTFATYGTPTGAPSGNWISTGGNPTGYMNVSFPKSSNQSPSGYWYQSFTIPTSSATGTLELQWSVTAYDPSATSLNIYAFVDTGSGAPTAGQQVWSSGNQTGTTAWTGTTTIDIGHKVSIGGTYYIKLAVQLVTTGGNKGPFTVGFDNSLLFWSGSGTGYPSDSPTIYPTTSFTDSNITSWDSFTETATKNGGEIYYQLSDNDGSTWQYWNGSAWTTATLATDYNTASTINTNIPTFSAAADKITFRAFLVGNGTQQVKLDNITIGYTAGAAAASGNFTSGTFDAGANVGFNRITWTDTTSVNNSVSFQVAVNSDNGNFNFSGPDGTTSTYYSLTNGAIALVDASGRYLKYKIYLTTTVASDKPIAHDVTVNYSP